VITADHVSHLAKLQNAKPLKNHQIPILFYDPSTKGNIIHTKRIQQIDILPSVLNYLNYTNPFMSFGNSYQSEDHLVINLINEKYHCIVDDYYFVFDGHAIIELYDLNKDQDLRQNLVSLEINTLHMLTNKIKAYLQSFHTYFNQHSTP